MNRKTIVFVALFVVGLVLDQVTKWWIRANLQLHVDDIQIIPGFLSIVHAENPGAAMGFLRDFAYRHFVFIGFTIVAVGVIVNMWRQLPDRDWFMSLTLGLILSGAIGNAVDRVLKQKVTDFIRVYTDIPWLKDWLIQKSPLHSNEWPSFNVADSALVVGVGLFLIYYLFIEEKEQAPPEPSESEKQSDDPAA